jgi:hypothetical protein
MRPWIRPLAAIASITLVANVAMIASGMGPNVPLLTVLGGLVGMAIWTFTELADTTPAGAPIAANVRPAPPARSERRVTRLRTGLAYAGPNGLVFEQLHESLVAVIDDQLRVVHQIDRSSDPDAARAVVGEELQAFIDDRAAATTALARPRRLDHILTLIEQL